MNLLITLLIFSLPLGVLTRFMIFPNVFIYLHDIFASLIFLLFLQDFIKNRRVADARIFVFASLFILTGFSSLMINTTYLNAEAFIASFAYLARFTVYLCLIFGVSNLSKNKASSIPSKLAIAGGLFILIGLIQYVFIKSLFDLYYLGWDEHRGRLFSSFFDPNFAGAFIVLVCILLGGLLIITSKKNNVKRLILFTVLIAGLLAIFLTHSRSALITLLVGGIAYLSMMRLYKHILALVFVIIIGLITFSNTKIEALNPFRIASSEARIDSAIDALKVFAKNPIMGVGFNAYRYAQDKYNLKVDSRVLISNSDAGTDNSYLFVLATTGVIGGFFFLGFWFTIIQRVYQNRGRFKGTSQIAIAIIISLAVNTIFNNSMFYIPIIAWVFILIGLTLNKKR